MRDRLLKITLDALFTMSGIATVILFQQEFRIGGALLIVAMLSTAIAEACYFASREMAKNR